MALKNFFQHAHTAQTSTVLHMRTSWN